MTEAPPHFIHDIQPVTLTISAEIDENHLLPFFPNSSDCSLDARFYEDIYSLTFPLNKAGEPEECPIDGSSEIRAGPDMLCTSDSSPLDTMMIAGRWTYQAEVLDNGNIRLLYSDNTVTFITTSPCGEANSSTSSSPWEFRPRLDSHYLRN
ncbi:MAG: hypothetical protein JSV44_07395 [Candidatus Zixiibacteriota bacterium]|nr:MAG: hypothetical protein JSV44_07395 [candidate division Zixibacteria bacterium]